MRKEKISLPDNYWESFVIQEDDFEFLYNHLLEHEQPLFTQDLLVLLIDRRINHEVTRLKKDLDGNKDIYIPKDQYQLNQRIIFPSFEWRKGEIIQVREGNNPDIGNFQVIKVKFDLGEEREFASNLKDHLLNNPPEFVYDGDSINSSKVLSKYKDRLSVLLQEGLNQNSDFVQIAGKWFPASLLMDINIGQLNIAEATLDMVGGGPLSTEKIMHHLDLDVGVNQNLTEFSLNWALQEDPRFDEVGPSGEILWFLHRLEPDDVLKVPPYLRYHRQVSFDPCSLSVEMKALEQDLNDELSIITNEKDYESIQKSSDKNVIKLIYPHWRAGSLPISQHMKSVFPSAYISPRVRFWFVDGQTKEKFPAWVLVKDGYVCGLKDWYKTRGVIPGSIIQIKRGQHPGEVMIQTGSQRSSRDYLRTVLVGSDGGIVFAMLRQVVRAEYDERMAIFVANPEGIDLIWEQTQKSNISLENIMINMMKNLEKLSPQGHVHASELYAAVNLVRRCPPGVIFSMLTSQEEFIHVGDLYYHLKG